MKKIYKIILLMIILLTLQIIIAINKVDAASATLTGNKTVNKGDTVTVTANVTAGAWNLTLSGAGKTEGFVGQTSQTSNANASKSLTFTANEVGTYKITLTGDITDYDTDENSTINKTTTITVKENSNSNTGGNNNSSGNSEEKPKAGTVSSCYINTVKVNEFLNVKNKESVPVKVNTTTNEGLTIYNNKTKKSYKAKSGATTNVQIVEGEQTLTITLDTGYKTTRRIISIKEGEEVKPNVIDETPNEDDIKVILKSLSIKGVTIIQLDGEEDVREDKIDLALTPKFSSDVYEYTIDIPEEQNDITKLEINAIGDKEDFKIEIKGNEDLVEGENIVTIIVKTKDGKNQQEYKIKVNKAPKTVETVATTEPVEEEEETQEEEPNNIIKTVIVIVTIVALVAGIIFAVVEYRYTNRNDEYEYDDTTYGTIEFEEEVNENEEYDEQEDIYDDEYEDRRQRKKGKHF